MQALTTELETRLARRALHQTINDDDVRQTSYYCVFSQRLGRGGSKAKRFRLMPDCARHGCLLFVLGNVQFLCGIAYRHV